MIAPDEATAVHAGDAAEWRAWLAAHSSAAADAWLVIQHAASEVPGVHTREAMSEALCFGWIDSLARKRDAHSFYLRFTPRRAGSNWSARNRADAERLIGAGLMTPAGQAAIDQAQQSGRWIVT